MKKTVSILLLALTGLAIFKSATPFLSYKANYEFIFKELCEFRGTDKHDDCDGFCYLRKTIHEHDGNSEDGHSNKAVHANLYSSIYGILHSEISIDSPFRNSKESNSTYLLNQYQIYLDLDSPPPRS